MPMTRRNSSRDRIQDHVDEVSTTTSTQWSELLVASAVPATVVAVKLAGEDGTGSARVADDHAGAVKEDVKGKPGMFSSFQRRTFSRISFKGGEAGPLLSRYSLLPLTSSDPRSILVFCLYFSSSKNPWLK